MIQPFMTLLKKFSKEFKNVEVQMVLYLKFTETKNTYWNVQIVIASREVIYFVSASVFAKLAKI